MGAIVSPDIGGMVADCAANAGVKALIRALSMDVARSGVRCSAICPEFVETDFSMATAQSEPDPVAALAARRTIASIPRGRKLEETGAFAAYLASDQAAWITGQPDAIDGG